MGETLMWSYIPKDYVIVDGGWWQYVFSIMAPLLTISQRNKMEIKIIINYRCRDIVLILRFGCSQINSLLWKTYLNSLEVSYT